MKAQLLLYITFVCFISQTSAQDVPGINQFMFNRQVYNPAAFGTDVAALNGALIYQTKWIGIEGAPRFFAAWGDYRFTDKRMAGGVNINHSSFGITRQKEFLLNYSYLLPLTKKMKLAMGLRAGLSNYAVRTSELENVYDPDDAVIAALDYSSTYGKIGAGFQLYTADYYFGIASPELFSGNKNFSMDSESSFSKKATYTIYGGGIIPLNDTYRLLPSAILINRPVYKSDNSNDGEKVKSTLLNAALLFEVNQFFWAGAGAGTNRRLSFMAGAYLSPRLRFGYAYETQKLGSTRFNTHELNLRFAVDNLF